MRLSRASSAVLTLTMAASTASAGPVLAATAEPVLVPPAYDKGLSEPREDSYYPAKGDDGVDVLHYDLDLEWRRAKRLLLGDATLRFRATADARRFQLDLGQSLSVRRVVVDGVATDAFEHTGKTLEVLRPVEADSRHTVRVVYRGTPEPVKAPTTRGDFSTVGMSVTDDGRLRTMQEPFGAFTWYPANDHPSDKALYDIKVSAPPTWVGVSNGTLVKRVDGKRRTMTTWRLSDPAASYLLTLAVGPYAHRRDTGPHGLALNFWVPRDRVGHYMKTLRHTATDLRWLEGKLGRYPFESAGAVIVPGGSAMETQTLVTYGARTWDPRNAREVMVHELAHQWYGNTVTPDDWTGLWLNEGMAMYLQARWSAKFTEATWKSWVSNFRYYNTRLRKVDGPPAAYFKDRFAEVCVYYCTAMMYEKLRQELDDQVFWKLVRRWPQTHLNSNADRRTFIAWLEAETGRELTEFFDDWLFSPTWPPTD